MLANMADFAKLRLALWRAIYKQQQAVCEAAKVHCAQLNTGANDTEAVRVTEGALVKEVKKLQGLEAEL